jgi:hypothetical protein
MKRSKRRFLWLIPALLLLAALTLFLPQRYYTAEELGITQLQSPNDADGDGLEDWMDMVLGARDYIATDPHYKSVYYAGGYPDDGYGVCTDVIWQAFRAAGYELKDLVDQVTLCNTEYVYPVGSKPYVPEKVDSLGDIYRKAQEAIGVAQKKANVAIKVSAKSPSGQKKYSVAIKKTDLTKKPMMSFERGILRKYLFQQHPAANTTM